MQTRLVLFAVHISAVPSLHLKKKGLIKAKQRPNRVKSVQLKASGNELIKPARNLEHTISTLISSPLRFTHQNITNPSQKGIKSQRTVRFHVRTFPPPTVLGPPSETREGVRGAGALRTKPYALVRTVTRIPQKG